MVDEPRKSHTRGGRWGLHHHLLLSRGRHHITHTDPADLLTLENPDGCPLSGSAQPQLGEFNRHFPTHTCAAPWTRT